MRALPAEFISVGIPIVPRQSANTRNIAERDARLTRRRGRLRHFVNGTGRLAKIPQWNLEIRSRLRYHQARLSFAASRRRQVNSMAAIKPRQQVSYEDL